MCVPHEEGRFRFYLKGEKKAGRGSGDTAQLLIENPILAKTHKSGGNLSCHISCGFISYKTVVPWEVFLFSEVFVAISKCRNRKINREA